MNNPAKAASVDDNQIFPRKSDFGHQMRRTKKRTFGYFCFNRQKCPQRSGRIERYKTRCESKRQHKKIHRSEEILSLSRQNRQLPHRSEPKKPMRLNEHHQKIHHNVKSPSLSRQSRQLPHRSEPREVDSKELRAVK